MLPGPRSREENTEGISLAPVASMVGPQLFFLPSREQTWKWDISMFNGKTWENDANICVKIGILKCQDKLPG
jgi:hypothetical protein